MTMLSPWMYAARSDAKNMIKSATSLVPPGQPRFRLIPGHLRVTGRACPAGGGIKMASFLFSRRQAILEDVCIPMI